MDGTTAAEVSLFGQVKEGQISTLFSILESADCKKSEYNVHEVVYRQDESGLDFRIISDTLSSLNEDVPKRNIQICWIGKPDPSKNRQSVVRPMILCPVFHGNAVTLLNSMNFKYSFEFVKKGFSFKSQNISIIIYNLFECSTILDSSSIFPVHESLWIVQAVSICTNLDMLAEIERNLINFCSSCNLLNICNLSKIDHRLFQ